MEPCEGGGGVEVKRWEFELPLQGVNGEGAPGDSGGSGGSGAMACWALPTADAAR